MNVILCVDDDNGMMFNNRRQSRDKAVCEKIIDITKNNNLFMNEYSFDLFREYDANNILVANDFLNKATDKDYCFVENIDLIQYENKINRLIIFRWNRKYPSDFKFSLTVSSWNVESTLDFQGNSHDKITMEVISR